jgi:hypothetical protein
MNELDREIAAHARSVVDNADCVIEVGGAYPDEYPERYRPAGHVVWRCLTCEVFGHAWPTEEMMADT